MEKKSELALTDADKFPKESLMERLSRRFGLDAVAISGPCEGQPLATCVVDQIEKHWDKVKQLGSNNKVNKLAIKLAESYMSKDDTQDCVKDLEGLGYKAAAAKGIAGYLKAYAIDQVAENEFDQGLGEVAQGPDTPVDDMAPAGDEVPPMGGDEVPPMDEGGIGEEMPSEPALEGPPELGGDLGGGGETVTVELPKELVQELGDALQAAGVGEPGMEGDAGLPPDAIPPEEEIGGAPEMPGLEGLEIEVTEEPGMGMGEPKDEVVPGEPAGETEDHKVEGGPGCAACGSAGCKGECGGGQKNMAAEGQQPPMAQAPVAEEKCTCDEDKCPKCGKTKEKKAPEAPEKGESKEHEAKESPEFEAGEKEEKKEEGGEEKKENPFKKEEGVTEASAQKPVKTAADGGIARLGPEMKLNNTDQIGPHKDKELGTAKEKAVEAPKPVSEGNLDTEGYSAGDKKFQDKATMGHEQKFDAKELDKGSVTGGNSSIMGKDESYPKGGPSVPAGSSPIGGEKQTGGDVSTKGTIIAKVDAVITPKGVMIDAGGKQVLAKHTITMKMVPAVEAGLKKIAFTDIDAFAAEAVKVIVEAEKSGLVDNVTKIPTAKLEAEKFTNDGKKEPEKGGAMTGKGSPAKEEGITKTDTSKKEANDFQNDAKKEPEKDGKKAGAEKEIKTAKPVEDPKPIADGNLETEGYSAGDKKFQDGKTLGHEQKLDAKEVSKSDVSKGSASEMGKDESFPTGKPDVPAGGGKMGNEQFDGGNVATKGTIIADTQKRELSEATMQNKLAEARIREERLKAASVYAADLLSQGEITAAEYSQELEKAAQLPVPAIQAMIANTRKARARITAKVAAASQGEVKVGMSIPVVIASNTEEISLVDRLTKEFKLTKDLDRIDTMPEKK